MEKGAFGLVSELSNRSNATHRKGGKGGKSELDFSVLRVSEYVCVLVCVFVRI